VKNLLPEEAGGDLSALCVWPDQVRHWYKYQWTSPLHFIDTPDKACSFVYSSKFPESKHYCKPSSEFLDSDDRDVQWTGDCHDPSGAKNMCVAGAIANFTSQLMHYKQGSADRKCKLPAALISASVPVKFCRGLIDACLNFI
jgi:hypothetical protein